MISRIYLKLVKYFVTLIITTIFACIILFFLTVGYPIVKDFHRWIRQHAQHIAHLTSDLLARGVSEEELNHFLISTSDSYESENVLYDSNLKIIAGSEGGKELNLPITDKMLTSIREKGIFVQPSHFRKPLIYMLPISGPQGETFYLLIYASFYQVKQAIAFTIGLIFLCFFLILGIYPLSKGFTKPLTQLTGALKEIAAGNFDTVIEVGDRNDELGDLLRVFRDMSKSVDTMIESRKMLLADISHELRSPLGRLNIAAELIKEMTLSPVTDRYIDNIEYEIQFMDNLLKQLSEYSTLNLPNIELKRSRFLACDLIEDVFKRYQPIMENKGITFFIASCESETFLEADYARITQVLNNLLDNAINACKANCKISLGLSVSRGGVTYYVTNTGDEIPSELREKIFDPLFRTDPSRNRKTGGLGLGLAISKKIVDHHGGTISCECLNGNTQFSFTLDHQLKES